MAPLQWVRPSARGPPDPKLLLLLAFILPWILPELAALLRFATLLYHFWYQSNQKRILQEHGLSLVRARAPALALLLSWPLYSSDN